jgi:anti-anti-sigma regulatory factor
VTGGPERRVVRLAGRFGAAQVPEFMHACSGAVSLTIDLTDLVSVDAAGLDALHRIRRRGASIAGASGYIRLKLGSSGGGTSDSGATE